MESYEAFIGQYLKDKQKNNRRLSYGEWVTAHIDPSDTQRREALQAALGTYGTSVPSYGQEGELLGRAGLTDSGYSHSLAAQNEVALWQAPLDIEKSQEQAFGEGYAKYLEQYEGKQQKARETAFSRLRTGKYTDYGKAYAHALSLGLNEENAKSVAKEAVAYNQSAQSDNRAALRRSVLDKLVRYRLTAKTGYPYAIECGLSEAEARVIAEVAEEIYFARKTGNYQVSFEDHYEEVENKVFDIYKGLPIDYIR